MNGFESTEMGDDLPEFTLAEIMVMESLFKEVGEKSLSQEFCQELVTSFNCKKNRTGKPPINWEQAQIWFQDRQKELAAKVTTSAVAHEEFKPPSDLTLTINGPEPQKPLGERIASLSELTFEAKSYKDFAWYDVASFLNHRVVSTTGEVEVRVRFAGFGYGEDEWVNIKRGVRERSIPLESSECHRVKVGDLVLCFRETDVRAIYCDAYIVEIQRTIHDMQGCSCIFVVRYDYDDVEGKVPLSSLCCRPT